MPEDSQQNSNDNKGESDQEIEEILTDMMEE
jgi:hypothetical protein